MINNINSNLYLNPLTFKGIYGKQSTGSMNIPINNKPLQYPSSETLLAQNNIHFCGKSCQQDESGINRLRLQKKIDKHKEKLQRKKEKEARELAKIPVSTVDEINKSIDILGKAAYPANVLSNYNREEEPFYIDGVPCHSIEGFLQSLKIPNEEEQRGLCLKSGSSARHVGRMLAKPYRWKDSQTLYWQGKAYKRDSEDYKELVRKAFEARFDHSQKYREALKDTIGYTLTHNCGNNNPEETVLTTDEFLSILNELRDRL